VLFMYCVSGCKNERSVGAAETQRQGWIAKVVDSASW